jgi:hypothetical protein
MSTPTGLEWRVTPITKFSRSLAVLELVAAVFWRAFNEAKPLAS